MCLPSVFPLFCQHRDAGEEVLPAKSDDDQNREDSYQRLVLATGEQHKYLIEGGFLSDNENLLQMVQNGSL